MPPVIDDRKNIGSYVHTRAWLVTSESECNRRYGSQAKLKVVNGKVLKVLNKKTKTGRSSYFIQARFLLGGKVFKNNAVSIRSVFPGLDPKLQSKEREAIEEAFLTDEQSTNIEDDDETFQPSGTSSDGDDMSSDYDEVSEVSQIEEEVEETAETNENEGENRGEMEAEIQQQPTREEDNQSTTTSTSSNVSRAGNDVDRNVVVECHGERWSYIPGAVKVNNPDIPNRLWRMRNIFAEDIYPGSGHAYSRLDAWLLMYGMENFNQFIECTNVELRRRGYK